MIGWRRRDRQGFEILPADPRLLAPFRTHLQSVMQSHPNALPSDPHIRRFLRASLLRDATCDTEAELALFDEWCQQWAANEAKQANEDRRKRFFRFTGRPKCKPPRTKSARARAESERRSAAQRLRWERARAKKLELLGQGVPLAEAEAASKVAAHRRMVPSSE